MDELDINEIDIFSKDEPYPFDFFIKVERDTAINVSIAAIITILAYFTIKKLF